MSNDEEKIRWFVVWEWAQRSQNWHTCAGLILDAVCCMSLFADREPEAARRLGEVVMEALGDDRGRSWPNGRNDSARTATRRSPTGNGASSRSLSSDGWTKRKVLRKRSRSRVTHAMAWNRCRPIAAGANSN